MTNKIHAVKKQLMLICVIFLLMFHFTSSVWVKPNTVLFKQVHLGIMMIIIIITKPFLRKKPDWIVGHIVDFIEIGFIFYELFYVGHDLDSFLLRSGAANSADIIIGTIYVVVLCDLGRRVVGVIMTSLAIAFVLQNLISNHLPGIFYGPPMKYSTMIDYLWMRSEGIFSAPVNTISSYVIFFMMFASVLNESGAGEFFIKLAHAIAGKSRGGPAKTAVIASASFGSISGSPISNVAGTGSMTIPLMKREGYSAAFAGAVEAVASTGGAIMPPMMGSSTFIIAATLGIRYIDVALHALIPALLYYLALFFMVDFRAAKLGLNPLADDKIPRIGNVIRDGGQLAIPLITIVVLLASGRSPAFSALTSTLTLIIITFMREWTRMSGRQLLKAMFNGVTNTSKVSVTAGVAGLIVGGVSISGVALIFAQQIADLSGGQLWLSLILVAFISLILGCGMTSAAVYITVATIMAPALEHMGVIPIAAHMFVFYFGIIGTITPPVALTAYTAAGISGASPKDTGWTAFRLGSAGYIVPFMFAYGPALVFEGTIPEIIIAFITATFGIWMMAGALEGWLFTKARTTERILMAVAALGTILVGISTDFAGIAIGVVVILMQVARKKKETMAIPASEGRCKV